jgi:predicted dehydrogenase
MTASASIGRGPRRAGERPVRIGVAGTGSLGFHHARILSNLPGVEMAGVYDLDDLRARSVGSQFDAPVRASLDELLEHSDALVVAVPTSAHEAVSVAALERGVHCLIEKPVAPSLEAADRILAAAEVSGVVVQVGHVERFNAALRAAEPYMGRPRFIESHRMAPFSPRSTDVAVVLDLMIHDVDLVCSLVGSPVVEIAASGVPVLTSSVDIASARLTFEDGAVANLTASRVSMERMRKLRIFQESGYLSLNLADGTGEYLRLKRKLPAFTGDDAGALAPLLAEGLEGLVERVALEGDGVEPLRRELENFRDAVLGRARPAVSGRDGREALALTLSIESHIRSHVADPHPA